MSYGIIRSYQDVASMSGHPMPCRGFFSNRVILHHGASCLVLLCHVSRDRVVTSVFLFFHEYPRQCHVIPRGVMLTVLSASS